MRIHFPSGKPDVMPIAADELGTHARRLVRRVKNFALFLAACASGFAFLALLGYATHDFALVNGGYRPAGMSPLTAIAILSLSAAVIAARSARDTLSQSFSIVAAVMGCTAIGGRLAFGDDPLGPGLANLVFGTGFDKAGRTSYATSITLVLLALPTAVSIRSFLSDTIYSAAMLVSGAALLGYAYGANDIQAITLFRDISLPTAGALFALSWGFLLVEPTRGWSAVVFSTYEGGGATRRQLSFLLIPVASGYILAKLMNEQFIGPGAAMAFMVISVVVPLGTLILRDGRLAERLAQVRVASDKRDAAHNSEMQLRLADQATELNTASAEKSKLDATLAQTQRLETVGQLTGGIAHDFNNLLQLIGGNLTLVKRFLPAGSERSLEHVEKAVTGVQKASKLTGQLLTFSRSQKLTIRPVDASEVIESVRTLASSAVGPDIELLFELQDKDMWLLSDADQLESALLNLIINSREAMPEGGHINIRSERRQDALGRLGRISIEVADNGIGMAPDVVRRATEPFFTTRAVGKGTGLGLSQVYGLVKQCGGEMEIDSEMGRGTTMTLLFNEVRHPSTTLSIVEVPDSKTESGLNRGTVLVVDDDEGVRETLVETLKAAGFTIIEACDGPSALALSKDAQLVAAVMDFLMPGMNGAELAREVKRARPSLPIVFVSGYSDTVALDGIAGALILRKPFSGERLTEAVTSLLY